MKCLGNIFGGFLVSCLQLENKYTYAGVRPIIIYLHVDFDS